jgi:hypothetical protein
MNPKHARRRAWAGGGAILLVAALLRRWALGTPDLWGDEILFLRMCAPDLSSVDIVRTHLNSFSVIGHLPVAGVLFNAFFRLTGLTGATDLPPGWVRLPAVGLGLLAILFTGLWVARTSPRGARAGWWAAWISAVQFGHIWYSREAYYYPALLAFGAASLWTGFRLLTPPPAEGAADRRWVWRVGWLVALTGLVFSHPSGLALAVGLAVYAAVLMAADRKLLADRMWVVASALLMGLGVRMLAGTGQAGHPHMAMLRFPAWVVAGDVVEALGLGPGLLRLSASLAGLAIGVALLARARGAPRAVRAAAALPLFLFFAVHMGGRVLFYQSRYFILLLPFFAWFFAEAIVAGLVRVPDRWRRPAAVAAGALLLIQVLPGLDGLYELRAKRDAHASLARAMETHLAPGTVVFWEGGHALRFIPGFHQPATRLHFSALPDASARAYREGKVESMLTEARAALPAVAYVEWMGLSGYAQRRELGPQHTPDEFVRRLTSQFGGCIEVRDPVLEHMMRARWHPVSVPRWADDAEGRMDAAVESATMRMYFSAPRPQRPSVRPPLPPARPGTGDMDGSTGSDR